MLLLPPPLLLLLLLLQLQMLPLLLLLLPACQRPSPPALFRFIYESCAELRQWFAPSAFATENQL